MLISEEERSQFDAWTGDDIQHADATRLRKAHQYYKSEGFEGIAAAVYARLKELGHTDEAAAALSLSSDAEARSSINEFQEKVKQHRRDHKVERPISEVGDLQPPVRLVRRGATKAVPESLSNHPSQESPTVRRSQDLLQTSDQQLVDDTLILPASGTVAVSSGGTTRQTGQPLVQQMEMRGSKRTQQLLEQNRGLSELDKHIVAKNARLKGNDFYRCGQYADAVEEYTLAIGLDPQTLVLYTNRAAAYLKLKEWEYAATDATSALDLGAAQGCTDEALLGKARLRRAEAFMGAHRHTEALRDYDHLLALMPDEPAAIRGAEKARAALGISGQQQQKEQQQKEQLATGGSSGMRRMAVQECEDDDTDSSGQLEAQTCVAGQQQAGVVQKVSLPLGMVAAMPAEASSGEITNQSSMVQASDAPQHAGGGGQEGSTAEQQFSDAQHETSSSTLVNTTVETTAAATTLSAESETDSGTESEDEAESAHTDSAVLLPSFDDQLEQLRLKGNNAFRAGEYREAVELYSIALAHAPDAVQVYINRAIAQLRLQQYKQAHEDATIAIALQSDNHKAYHKRQQAKQRLEDYQGAIMDMQQCIKLAPKDLRAALSVELQALQDLSASTDATARAEAAAAQAAGFTDHGSVQIQEEVEDPEETKQRRHDELVSAEQLFARKAAKAQQRASEQRDAWRQQQEEQAKQLAEAAAAKRQARETARAARREAKRKDREQRKDMTAAMEASTAVEPIVNTQPGNLDPVTATAGALQEQHDRSVAAQQQGHIPDMPAAANHSIEAQVEALKDRGNQMLAAGRYDDAEAAYVEALQLDGDNVKVLLNLALLRLKQEDGAGALRCCEEVLTQQQLGQEHLMKAQLRRALAWDLLGDSAAALGELAIVWEQRQAAGLPSDPQLAADMNRIANKVKQQPQLQQSKPELSKPNQAATPDQASTFDIAPAISAETDQQQAPQVAQDMSGSSTVTGMRASIPVTVESDSDGEIESETGNEPIAEHNQQVQQLLGDVSVTSASAADGPQQQQKHLAELIQQTPESTLSDETTSCTAAVPAQSTSRCKIPVVEESSDSEAEEPSDKAAEEQYPDSKVPVTVEELHEEAPAQTAKILQQQSGVQSPERSEGHHKRSQSSGDITEGTATAAETALDVMRKLLEKEVARDHKPGASDSSRNLQPQMQQSPPAGKASAAAAEVADDQQQWEAQRLAELNLRRVEVLRAALQTTIYKDADGGTTAITQLHRTAEEQREKGNAAFSKGQLQQALKHYNAALSVAPMDEKSYANRAQVYLKLKRWQQVEADCNTALLLLRKASESVNPVAPLAPQTASAQLRQKCMYRRALAWKGMGKMREAIGEAKQLLKENPNDSAVQRLMSDLKVAYSKHLQTLVAQQSQAAEQEQQQQQHADQQQEVKQSDSIPNTPSAAAEPISQVHRHRIVIEETDDSGSEEEDHDNQQQAVSAAAIKHVTEPERATHAVDLSRQQQEPQQQANTPSISTPGATPQQIGNGVHASAAALTQRAVQQVMQQKQLTAPRSAVEFMRVAKSLCCATGSTETTAAANGAGAQQQQSLGQYVRLLEPSRYTTVFKRDLSDAVVEFLLLGLQDIVNSDPSFVTQALQQLDKVERSGIVLPMAFRKKRVSESLQYIVQQLTAAGQPVEELKTLYKLA